MANSKLTAEVLVFGVRRYQFADKQTGEVMEGTTVHYADTSTQDGDQKGYVPAKANLKFEDYSIFKDENLPGIYEAQMDMVLRGSKPSLKVTGFRFLKKAQ